MKAIVMNGVRLSQQDVDLSPATWEVCVQTLRRPDWGQRRVGRKLLISQPAVSQHIAIACERYPMLASLLRRPRGRGRAPRLFADLPDRAPVRQAIAN